MSHQLYVEEMKNKFGVYQGWRPANCPFKNTCTVMWDGRDGACGGIMDEPVDHHDDFNTHRLCLFECPEQQHCSRQDAHSHPGTLIISMKVNHYDLCVLSNVIKRLKPTARAVYQIEKNKREAVSNKQDVSE